MSSDHGGPYGPDKLKVRYLWVPHGEEPDPAALAQFREPIRVPARFVPRKPEQDEPMQVAQARRNNQSPPGSFAPVGRNVASRHGASNENRATRPEAVGEQNVHDLAAVIYAESRGRPVTEQTAVGYAVRNRMIRNHVMTVREVWGGFAQLVPQQQDAPIYERLARDILDGSAADETHGATHFYSPSQMPRAGQPTGRRDVRGGLETTPGHVDPMTGQPVQTYRPSWTVDPLFAPVTVPQVDPWFFRFYTEQGRSRVR